ncbi:hypothetical protein Tco_0114317, partial [Tanacetum coccineum]
DAVDWAMQALLRARFRDLSTVDMKEIFQQRMFEENTYKTHEVYNDLYEALQKSVELDYSNQRLDDQEEARASGAPELSPTDYLMPDDSIPKKQVHLSNDEDSENDNQPKADSRKDWWKPLPEEERPATPEPAWTTFLLPTCQMLRTTRPLCWPQPMSTLLRIQYCRQVNKTTLTQADFEGHV